VLMSGFSRRGSVIPVAGVATGGGGVVGGGWGGWGWGGGGVVGCEVLHQSP